MESSRGRKKNTEVCGIILKNKDIGIYNAVKHVLDIILTLISLTLVIPTIVVFSIVIIIESPGNPFFLQTRMGHMGKEFKLIKLRSMHLDAEKTGAKWAEQNDPRVTKVGKFIRKTRIDELPQVFNILKGDMSIIGPRPERKIFVEEFIKTIPDFPKRLEINPGLTGWAQVNGGYDISPTEKLALDLFYIEKTNPKLDVIIIIKTIQTVITGAGSR